MTKADWNPERDLAAVLDALTEELLATPDRDVVGSLYGMGKQAQDTIAEMRRLVAAADAGCFVPPAAQFIGRALRAYVARDQ